eukprot:CAMPEP_0172577786 /NCGR_PEP_ID=MMETSP1067-20121228/138407_1 /TAXON_ID=265564 ORGANISM="Thalassiosira punctigera, Strain Tpunct2005C2" /NCGR_SAMPLE_ID=MMETSP1067 /ASSEMBLY_ACC=CAM_ASM_000444 /LENGTH=648 /DNA_ID=CAMNT_0013370477 /DNA_START=221 /DNA_END=2166 /DNA_ORIENTATION=+
MRRRSTATRMRRVSSAACCCCYLLLPPSMPVAGALLQTLPGQRADIRGRSRPTARGVFFKNDDKNGRTTLRHENVNGDDGGGVDLFKTLELKDQALVQAQSAVSSLEKALGSAVTNLENMQQQLQMQVVQMEQELETTKLELSDTQAELEQTKSELRETQAELMRSRGESEQLELALVQSKKAADRADKLEAYVKDLEEDAAASAPQQQLLRKESDNSGSNPWQLFSTSTKSTPVLNEWIAIKGTNEGEVQISGKVTSHPTIPDGDAIVTSPLVDPAGAAERKVVTTSSGSKYRLGTPMTMPSSDSQSVKITSERKEKPRRQLVRARSSISIPDLTGDTLGNGRYLLAGDATSSINGRSYIQTAYRSSPFGKPMGESLAIKYSPNKEAMKREFANYQKVSSGLKRGSFIRRLEFLPTAGSEMPDQSALVMQRGVADVKAFMPKVGGRLEGELLRDCALTALRCVEAAALRSTGVERPQDGELRGGGGPEDGRGELPGNRPGELHAGEDAASGLHARGVPARVRAELPGRGGGELRPGVLLRRLVVRDVFVRDRHREGVLRRIQRREDHPDPPQLCAEHRQGGGSGVGRFDRAVPGARSGGSAERGADREAPVLRVGGEEPVRLPIWGLDLIHLIVMGDCFQQKLRAMR